MVGALESEPGESDVGSLGDVGDGGLRCDTAGGADWGGEGEGVGGGMDLEQAGQADSESDATGKAKVGWEHVRAFLVLYWTAGLHLLRWLAGPWIGRADDLQLAQQNGYF